MTIADELRAEPLAPAITVIVPVFNGEDTIEACIASLLAVDVPRARYEIVVVDNASTDATARVLAGFGDSIRVLRETTRGASAARNTGIREARGSIVALTDADCTVEPGWLAALVRPLQDDTVGIVGGRILSRVGANRIERFGERIHDHRVAIEREDSPYVISMNWASRRAVLLESGLFDLALLRGQDVDLAWRIHHRGLRLVYAPDAIIRHRNENTLTGLVREAWVHGHHGVAVRTRNARGDAILPTLPVRHRLRQMWRRAKRETNPVDRVLWIMCDLAKIVGEIDAIQVANSSVRQPAAMRRA